MNVVKTIPVHGWLPSGLILNTAFDGNDATQTMFCPDVSNGVKHVRSGNYDVDVTLGSFSQATKTTMLVPKGRFLSPVVMGLLNETGLHPHEVNANCLDHARTSPYSAACVLFASVKFEGEIVVYSGNDLPTARLSFGGIVRDFSDYLTVKIMARPNVWDNAIEISLPTAVYVPNSSATAGVYSFPDNMPNVKLAANLHVTRLADDSPLLETVYTNQLIAPFTEFRRDPSMFAGLSIIRKPRFGAGTKGESFAVQATPSVNIAYKAFITPDMEGSQIVLARSNADEDVRDLATVTLTDGDESYTVGNVIEAIFSVRPGEVLGSANPVFLIPGADHAIDSDVHL